MIGASSNYVISAKEEKERYLSHNNGIDQPGYVKFLKRAVDPAEKFIYEDMLGLDYGCGYSPTLSKILEQKGYSCEDYDPYFVPNELNKKYDFIFSTEVFEHFENPAAELETIDQILKRNGLLIIMTERWDDLNRFGKWYYTRDESHIVFYHDETFDYICEEFGYQKIYDDEKRVIILRKS